MLTVKSLRINIKSGSRSTELLRDLNFRIEPGKIFTIVGKNGEGKSTLIKSLTKLLPSNRYTVSGEIYWKQSNIYDLTDTELLKIRRAEIKYVFQETNDCLDDLRRLKYYFDRSGGSRGEIINLLGYFMLPGYESIISSHPYELSGGMAQRVNIVLALLSRPELLIMDEPTSAVDLPLVNLIIFKLRDFVKTGTNSVLLITQDLHLALKISDRIAFLSKGTLEDFKPPAEFIESRGNEALRIFLDSSGRLGELSC